jgi:hypothetical protein
VATTPQQPHPLQPVLREAEAELSRRLKEACEAEANGVASESSAEIRRLEDALLAAAVAAEHTLTLRQHLEKNTKARPSHDAEVPITAAAEPEKSTTAPEAAPGSTAGAVREFRDSEGRAWRAWPVTPGNSRTGRTKNFLGDFQLGWICFEGLGDAGRRRLAGHPPRWTELSERELDALLNQAISVRERRPVTEAEATTRPVR